MRRTITLTMLAASTLLVGLAACVSTETNNCPNTSTGGQGGTTSQGGGGSNPGTKADGEACQADDECIGGLCLTEGALGWGHGYCSQLCAEVGDPPLVPCHSGSTCAAFGSGFAACLETCSQPSDCRDATYDCVSISDDPPLSVCAFKECTVNADCDGGCDLDSGYCTATPENCANSSDDDGDGYADCEELDCAANATCTASIAAACTAATDISAGGTFNGNTATGTSLFAGICGNGFTGYYPIGNGFNENVYLYTAAAAIRVAFTLDVSAGAADWYTRETCDDGASEVSCGSTDATAPGTLTVDFANGDSQYLYIDGYGGDATYTLKVETQDPAGECQAAIQALAGDTAGDLADGSFAFVGSCGPDGAVLVYKYTPGADGTIDVTVTPGDADLDLALYARTSCADTDTELDCSDDGWGGEVDSLAGLAVSNAVPIYLFVQNWGGQTGLFTLNIKVN